jgi:hypothetical protein
VSRLVGSEMCIRDRAQGDLTRPLDEEMNRDIAEFGVTPLFDGAALDRI